MDLSVILGQRIVVRGVSRCRGVAGSGVEECLGSGTAAKRMKGFLQGRHLRLECLEERRLLSLAPIISEVEAGNKHGIVDTLGNSADWLEIYNPDPTTAVNLSGWTLSYQKTGEYDQLDVDLPQRRGPWSWGVPRDFLRFK